MSLREVSWADEEEFDEITHVAVTASVPVVNSYNNNKKQGKVEEKEEIPQWSVDTRGDLPTQKVLPSQSATSTYSTSTSPKWPEESAAPSQEYSSSYSQSSSSNSNNSNSNSNSSSNCNQLPPLTRRPGRDSMPGSRGGRASGPGADGERPPKPAGGNGRGRLDDISTLNIPGIDLNMLPRATTGLSFRGSNDRNDRVNDRNDRGDRDFDRSDRNDRSPRSNDRAPVSRHEYENRDEYGSRPGPSISYEAPAPADNNDLSWGDEPEVAAPAVPAPIVQKERAAPIRQAEPVEVEPVAKVPSYSSSSSYAPAASVINEVNRLDCDGWGDEPEEVDVPVVRKPEPVEHKVEPVIERRKPEPVHVPSVSTAVPAPVLVAPTTTSPTMPSMQMPMPVAMSHSSSQGHMFPYPYPLMMSHQGQPQQPGACINNPMSPVGQMPPMSMMPGMMMPIWVTCPFCYHCYMYPPVVPAAVPATQAQN